MAAWICWVIGRLALTCLAGSVVDTQFEESAERRALAYLSKEVPRWSAENKCFSCHNNGDAARALYAAVRLCYPISAAVLEDTSGWLVTPARWEHNGGEGPFSDKKLARIQFAAALGAAVDAGRVKDRNALIRAAQLVAADQAADGSWAGDVAAAVGSPATYGRPLATYVARETLRKADSRRFAPQIERADAWLRRVDVRNILDAAVVLLACMGNEHPESITQQNRAMELVRRGQSSDGGWGPYVTAAPEAFDTAVVLLALCRLTATPDVKSMAERGRAFLIANQLADGSWPETTRPAGAESYAQRLSTTGWATLALLATREMSEPR